MIQHETRLKVADNSGAREFEARQFRYVGSHHRDVRLRKPAGEHHETWLIDAGRMEPGDEQHRLTRMPKRGIDARAYPRSFDRDADEVLVDGRDVEVGEAASNAVPIGRADDQSESVDVSRGTDPQQQYRRREPEANQQPPSRHFVSRDGERRRRGEPALGPQTSPYRLGHAWKSFVLREG